MLGLQTHQHQNTRTVIRAGSSLDGLLPEGGLKVSSARYSDGTSTSLVQMKKLSLKCQSAPRWSEGHRRREVGNLLLTMTDSSSLLCS